MTEFQKALDKELLREIEYSLDQGTVGMSLDCLMANASTQDLLFKDGAPKGTNARWLFNQEFKDSVKRISAIAKSRGFEIY